jgi:hypothetical protein
MAAGTTVSRLAGWGGKSFFNMNSGATILPNIVDIACVDLGQAGAPQATRVTSLSIAAQMVTAPATAGAPAIFRWAIVTGSGDVAAALLQAMQTSALATQWNSPWGGQGEYAFGFPGNTGIPAAMLSLSTIVLAEGLVIANPVGPSISGTPPAVYSWDDNDDQQGGPGTVIAPPGQWCQLLVTAPAYQPAAAQNTQNLSHIFLTIRGNQVASPYTSAAGLPQASFTTRN